MKRAILVVALAMLSGCATQTFNMQSGGPEEPTQETMQPFFISGLGQQKTVDAAQVCGSADKVSRVETELTFVEGLIGTLTLGIYTPRTARVYCTP